jgi:hypothetical protein
MRNPYFWRLKFMSLVVSLLFASGDQCLSQGCWGLYHPPPLAPGSSSIHRRFLQDEGLHAILEGIDNSISIDEAVLIDAANAGLTAEGWRIDPGSPGTISITVYPLPELGDSGRWCGVSVAAGTPGSDVQNEMGGDGPIKTLTSIRLEAGGVQPVIDAARRLASNVAHQLKLKRIDLSISSPLTNDYLFPGSDYRLPER